MACCEQREQGTFFLFQNLFAEDMDIQNTIPYSKDWDSTLKTKSALLEEVEPNVHLTAVAIWVTSLRNSKWL